MACVPRMWIGDYDLDDEDDTRSLVATLTDHRGELRHLEIIFDVVEAECLYNNSISFCTELMSIFEPLRNVSVRGRVQLQVRYYGQFITRRLDQEEEFDEAIAGLEKVMMGEMKLEELDWAFAIGLSGFISMGY